MNPIEVIRPKIFAGNNDVLRTFFTLKNEHLKENTSKIAGLNLGFNTGEDAEVIKYNRQYLLDTFDIEPAWIAFANQVHSNRIKIVTSGGTFAETDALITQVPGLALAIQVADCAAILIADMQSKMIAAIHAGWRGAVGDILPQTLQKMSLAGANIPFAKAFISPCIAKKNFEVGEEVADQFPDQFVDYTSYKKPHIDLKAFLAFQLRQAGIKEKNIEVHPGCTLAESQYYSYRRQGEASGRMIGIIQLKEVMI